MTRYRIEWRGRITRDAGVEYITAKTPRDAKRIFESRTNNIRVILGIYEDKE